MLKFQFDNQAFYPGIEIVKLLAVYPSRSEEGISLLSHNRKYLVDRFFTVLYFIRSIHAQVGGNFLCLIDLATANGASINLDQSDNIRVNAISAGPIKTLAAAGIGSFSKLLSFAAKTAPLKRNVTTEEVGNAAAFLLSNLASGITGEITYVDAGFNTAGVAPLD